MNASPIATIKWITNGTELVNTSINGRTKIAIKNSTKGSCIATKGDCTTNELCKPSEFCETSSTLEVYDAEPADSGVYICDVTSEEGSDSQRINITLHVNGIKFCFNLES